MSYVNAEATESTGFDVESLSADQPPSESANAVNDGFSFESMRLKVGDRLQVQLPARFSSEKIIVRMIGYVSNLSLLITPPRDVNGLRITVEEGEDLYVRVFSSQNAFFFLTTVEKLIRVPFEYLHLSFPRDVKGTTVRKAPRVKTKIICSFGQSKGSEESVTGILANLSANGALLVARNDALDVGEQIKLNFRLLIHGIEVILSVAAVVRSRFVDESAPKPDAVYYGLEFSDQKPSDTMALQSMVYQQIIEQPQAII